MEAVALGAFLNTFMPKVREVITEACGLSEQIEEDIVYLKEELTTIDAYIRKQGLECTSPSSEETISRRACKLAEDTELCISRFLLYQSQKKKTHSRRKMSRSKFSGEIKEFRRRLDIIREELKNKKEEVKGSTISFEEPNDPQWGEEELAGVGMDLPRKELEELLGLKEPEELLDLKEPESASMRKLKVISIVGFGGSGKTLLAKQVYEKLKDSKKFRRKAMVCMANRDPNEVLEEILQKVNNDTGSSTGVQHVDNGAGSSTGLQHVDSGASASTSVTGMPKSCLSTQRYFIVIDDVRSQKKWRDLKKALPDSDFGSRIIVTTTSQPVAELCSSTSGHVYKMSTLCDQDSQELFLNASSKKPSLAQEGQLSTLMKTCDGLPLALIESAKPFKEGKTVSRGECQTTIRELCVPEGTNVSKLTRMQWVLMNKYSGLTSYGARACLLYFHMFPSENPTKEKFLTRRWLAEGLVQRDAANCSDLDVASRYLRTFRESSIIRSMQVSNIATVKSCTLPGTMRQFITRQSESQDFVTFLRGKDEPPKQKNDTIRRLSLHDSQVCLTDVVKLNLLRTLAVSGMAFDEDILDFSKYEVLQVLDLKQWDLKQLEFDQLEKGKNLPDILKDICKLIMLKYLGLPDKIGEVPREIADLIHLETLDVGGAEIVTLYGEVIKLPALKHLLGKFRLSPKDSPGKYFPKKSKLETFSGFVTDEKAAFPKLMKHMTMLKKVKMWCDFEAEDSGKPISAAIKDFILKGSITDPCDRSLSIDVKGCKVPFLESLETQGSLIKLKVHGTLKKVPEFITPIQVYGPIQVDGKPEWISPPLHRLTKLCLSLTTLCTVMPPSDISPFPLQGDALLLPYLIYLKLVEVHLGPLEILEQHFISLERICLVGEESIKSITIGAKALQHLVSLHVICEKLNGLAGIQIGGLINLKEIALHPKVTPTTEKAWKDAARGHPNKPQVFFIETS